jgi:hypothetical protein
MYLRVFDTTDNSTPCGSRNKPFSGRVITESRKTDRMNVDGTFLPDLKGKISTTFTSDWYLDKGENRDKLGEWVKKTTVRSLYKALWISEGRFTTEDNINKGEPQEMFKKISRTRHELPRPTL